ncbi:uncharacterized protein HGUI_00529 [Hanseniaspora guilliermondii]|uniref:Essential for maintenance of the cell wall protein 1 n=1 Tax=Hanseniaspora guilliermondii TaxID=56406 RepID=A0A1L0CJ16_9ASCO|nr:uncharacterized protein HGUI_00529 [Hanseniaspora guilliermondii]
MNTTSHFKLLLNITDEYETDELTTIINDLQKFIQVNFTNIEKGQPEKLDIETSNKLSIGGHLPYAFLREPKLFLSIKENIQKLMKSKDCDLQNMKNNTDIQLLLIYWYCRVMSIHLSFFTQSVLMANDPQVDILQSFFCGDEEIVHNLTLNIEDMALKQKTAQMYYLESCKVSILLHNEHLYAGRCLDKYTNLSNVEYVLTGAKVQRTKFQTKFHNNLIILAESSQEQIQFEERLFKQTDTSIESFKLNHETLLEKPVFIKGAENNDENEDLPEYNNKFLKTVATSAELPSKLSNLDYNKQPKLTFFDEIQFLLRLEAIKISSPAKDPLVEQELMAIIERLTSNIDGCNSLIFTYTLWERSLIETGKAKTIERALLQMEQLINDLQDADFQFDNQFFYLLPPRPNWILQSQLAEKYMELGVVKSAMEIYRRLHMYNELALCHCAIGEEKQGLKILEDTLLENPNEFRSLSIIGDIKQDPSYWERAWNEGRYTNAKISLAKHTFYKLNDLKGALNHFEACNIMRSNLDNIYLYGCIAMQAEEWNKARLAFQKCVQIDDTNMKAWSNLGAALLELNMFEQAHSAFSKAVSLTNGSQHTMKSNWQIIQNLMILSLRLHRWSDVLSTYSKLLDTQNLIDIEAIQALFEELTNQGNSKSYQTKLIALFEQELPTKIASMQTPEISQVYKILSRYELLQKRPWNSLNYAEISFRNVVNNVAITTEKSVFVKAVEEMEDLLSSYENLGPMDGRIEGSLVCKNWEYKCKMTIKLLMSKCVNYWSSEPEWDRILELRSDY